jgi:adenylate kinase
MSGWRLVRVLLIGPPGAGKGTQARRIAEHFGVRHISSGEIFRRHVAEGSPEGLAVAGYLERGDLVPDDLVLSMVGGEVIEASAAGGYVLDGYPRTLEQAETAYRVAAEVGVTVQAVLYLDVDHAELIRRLGARASGEGRTDDNLETARHRIDVYMEKTKPLLDYYGGRGILHTIDGNRPVTEITADILAILRQ